MLEEKGKELGRLIGQSPEYQALKRSSDALNDDREAVALLQQMEKLRGSLSWFRGPSSKVANSGPAPRAAAGEEVHSRLR